MSGVYLSTYLQPFQAYLDRPDVTDLWVNKAGEIWLESAAGGTEKVIEPAITPQVLDRLARQIAATTHQGFNRTQPIMSAALPDGSRVQIVGPPATRDGVVMAIRRHTLSDLDLTELAQGGMFSSLDQTASGHVDADLDALLAAGDYERFLVAAVQARKTILLSGGTSSGKTTLMNALMKAIPPTERLIVIEDVPEVRLVHENVVGLIATRGDGGEAQIEVEDLLQAALRMRPDRIMLGELRGREAFAFLRAVNTGHPGSITTVHADSAQGAFDQIALLALMGEADLGWDNIRAYIRQVVDIVVQLKRVDGQRRIVEILQLKR